MNPKETNEEIIIWFDSDVTYPITGEGIESLEEMNDWEATTEQQI